MRVAGVGLKIDARVVSHRCHGVIRSLMKGTGSGPMAEAVGKAEHGFLKKTRLSDGKI